MKTIFLLLLLISGSCFSQVNLDFGLMAYYPFSGNAKDASGNNNHPVYNNATLTSDRFGSPRSAYHFNGKSSYMQIPNHRTLNMGSKLSISLWVRPTGFYTGKCYNNMMVMKGHSDQIPGIYSLRFSALWEGCGPNPTTTDEKFFDGFGTIATTPVVKLNQWYHVVVTFDGARTNLYVNCVLQASTKAKHYFTNEYDLFFGHLDNWQYPYWLNGDLDEIRIYNRALNRDEVLSLCDKKPEFVKAKPKEKKSTAITKPETVAQGPQTVAASNPLITINEPVDLNAKFIKPLDFETRQEVVLEERRSDLIREIIVEHDSISVTLYDNGIVDGDSVTLTYNGKILTTHQLLTGKPVTFYIKIDKNKNNELLMYAENLGSIPPNTALMVIYDGEKRYELNVSSSKTSNGVVSFKFRE